MGLIWLILNKITHITSLNQAKRDAAVKSSLWNKDTDQYILLQCSVQFSHSVVSDSFQPHGLQHARPPCPSPSSCPLSSWCHPTISSSVVPFSSCAQFFPGSFFRVFSNESALCIRWPKYWSYSFNISPSNEYPRLISFRMDWLDQYSKSIQLILRPSRGLMTESPLANQSYCPEANINSFWSPSTY